MSLRRLLRLNPIAIYCYRFQIAIFLFMNRETRSLERQIEKVKKELTQLGPLRVGSITEQYNVCGTPDCRCKASPPQKHGPYYQLSYARKGKSTTRFVRPENLSEVKSQLQNYKRLRTLVDRWIDAEIELADLRMRAPKHADSRPRK